MVESWDGDKQEYHLTITLSNGVILRGEVEDSRFKYMFEEPQIPNDDFAYEEITDMTSAFSWSVISPTIYPK
jgi:hypothetical protein